MKSVQTCVLFCALSLATTAPLASAGIQGLPQVAGQPAARDPHREFLQALADAQRNLHARHRTPQRRPRAKPREIEPDADFMKPRSTPRPVASKSVQRVQSDTTRTADAREAAERTARAEYLYRVSQTSAPIIANARACKRIGAQGESIYENCGTTLAAGAGGSR